MMTKRLPGFLLLLTLTRVAGADAPGLAAVAEWQRDLFTSRPQRMAGTFVPIAFEGGNGEPQYHAFVADEADSTPALRYCESKTPTLRWGKARYALPAVTARWRRPDDPTDWSPDSIRRYQWPTTVAGKPQTLTCLDAAFAGLGSSGGLASWRAVLVLQAGKPREWLYFAGYGASCEAVGTLNDGRIGFVQLTRRDGDDGLSAQVFALAGRGKLVPVQAYVLRDDAGAVKGLRVDSLSAAASH